VAAPTLLEVDSDDFDSDFVSIQDSLHQLADPGGDLVTFFSER
jgi:hypothetical protein